MLDTLNLDQLRVLVAIADLGSFSAAARHLRRAQSAISHAIQNLEQALGLPLFDRSGWKPAFTAEGRRLLQEARAVLAQTEQLKARARSLREGRPATLGLVVDAMVPSAWLAAGVTAFQQAWPGVQLSLRTELSGAVLGKVLDGSHGVGLVLGLQGPQPGLQWLRLGQLPIVPVAVLGHPLSGQSGLRAADLREHTQVVLAEAAAGGGPSDPSGPAGHLGPVEPQGPLFQVHAERPLLTSDLRTLRALVLDGAGWGFVPRHAVQQALDAGQLVTLDLADSVLGKPCLPLHWVQLSDGPPNPAAAWWQGRALAPQSH